MTRVRALVLAVVCVVAGAVAAGLVAGSSATAAGTGTSAQVAGPAARASATRGPVGSVGGVGIFTERCGYSHTANVDPILMPGMTGMSMLHDFFGNAGTDQNSTAATLAGGPSTCATSADSSAYWTPVLYQNGGQLRPVRATIYWRARAGVASTVHTMPTGLSMIAGDEQASSPQGRGRVAWTCVSASAVTTRPTATPHSCPAGADLRVAITFPSCWDGRTLDGATQTNVVYPGRRGACPADHPVRLPELVLHVVYPTRSVVGLTLSTGMATAGSVNTEHADFINAFTPAPLARDVAACIVAHVRCGPVTGHNATPLALRPAARRH